MRPEFRNKGAYQGGGWLGVGVVSVLQQTDEQRQHPHPYCPEGLDHQTNRGRIQVQKQGRFSAGGGRGVCVGIQGQHPHPDRPDVLDHET